jgi:predicted TPR repeat methyltransferase
VLQNIWRAGSLPYISLGEAFHTSHPRGGNLNSQSTVDAVSKLMEFNQPLEQLITANQWQEAKSLCESWLTQEPTSFHAHYSMGLICAKLGLVIEAMTHFEKSLSLNPHQIACFINLSNLYVLMEQPEKAKRYLNQALRFNPHYAEAYNNLGQILYKQGLLQDAIAHFKKALRLNPNYWEAHYNLAHSFTKINRLTSAILQYNEVIRLVPNHPSAHLNLGLLYFEEHHYPEAAIHLHKELDLHPDNRTASYYLGHTHLALGHANEAIDAFNNALLDTDPKNYADIHHNLAVLYLRNQDTKKALDHFEQTLVYQPINDTARHMILSLQGAETSPRAPNLYITDLFNQYADYYDKHVKHSLNYAVPGLLRSAVGRCLGNQLKAGHMLDLGCGTGLCGVYFRDLALDMVGVDISPKMIEKARQLGAYDSVITSDVLDYITTYKKDPDFYPFDLIIAGDVLVYFGDLTILFKEIRTLLVQGGHFAFTTEDDPAEVRNKDYILKSTGRYAHSIDYISRLSSENNLLVEVDESIIPREQDGQPIQGRLYILRNLN